MAGNLIPIQSTVLTGSQASVTFSSIPQTYTDLVLRCSIRTNNGSNEFPLALILNNNTSTLYSYTRLQGYSNGPSSTRVSNDVESNIGSVPDTISTSNTFSSTEIYIPNYTTTTSKPFLTTNFMENNVTTYVFQTHQAVLYRNSTGITTIKLQAPSGYSAAMLVSGSSFYLYGVL